MVKFYQTVSSIGSTLFTLHKSVHIYSEIFIYGEKK